MPGMSSPGRRPKGVILAGGLGRRLGGPKAAVQLRGRPLISYPLRALRESLGDVVVVAKLDSALPALPGVEVWIEPDLPRHPLTGLVHALSLSGGSRIVVCACDLPLVTPSLVREIVDADPGGASAVIASSEGRLQPLLGCYEAGALGPLSAALGREGVPLREAVSALGPRIVEVSDPRLLFNINTPEDLLKARSLLEDPSRDQPNVKS
jgi:molybdopterin-guanine dinucleotide biosynthesis protein A